MTAVREGLPALPSRFLKLPVDPRGYPIPWFVAVVDGKHDFRLADPVKRAEAHRSRLCWLCGEKLGRYMAFVLGPMGVVNRNTSEPGCHLECAEFAAKACPFLTRPRARYRDANLPLESKLLAGAIPGNPGACAVYVCTRSTAYKVPGTDDWLIRLGDPAFVYWWSEGKPATRARILEVLEDRLPLLRKLAEEEGPEAVEYLNVAVRTTHALLPAA